MCDKIEQGKITFTYINRGGQKYNVTIVEG